RFSGLRVARYAATVAGRAAFGRAAFAGERDFLATILFLVFGFSASLARRTRPVKIDTSLLETYPDARIRLPLASCSSSHSPSASINGGTYTPNRPRSPFFSPYHPPFGF